MQGQLKTFMATLSTTASAQAAPMAFDAGPEGSRPAAVEDQPVKVLSFEMSGVDPAIANKWCAGLRLTIV